MKTVFAPLVLVFLILRSPLAAHSGHTVWGAWRFDWEVKDSAGLAIWNVYYDNEFVIYKASMPVIRVQYAGNACGPYADQITWGSLVNIGGRCGGAKVCQTSYTAGGVNWLELAIYSRIGAYHLYQGWYFSHTGQIDARLFSKGLQCSADHNHHPYWRMDIDIKGASSDQIFVYDNNRPDQGWGPGWMKYTQERNHLKSSSTARKWFVRDNPTGHGLWVIPGPDGISDSFSSKDVAFRRYKGAEDVSWAFGAWGHLGYNEGEDIQEKDVVFWYVSHLHHEASGGGDQWHWAGPTLRVAR